MPIYLTKIGKVIIRLTQFGSFLPLLSFIFMHFFGLYYFKRMNVYNKRDKWPNEHEQIDFQGVDEELCLIKYQ